MTARTPRWTLRETDVEGWRELADHFDLHPLVARMLARRGIDDLERAERFLEPSLAHMHDPFSMADMDRAVSTIADALEAGDAIAIHGDYDVDGISSTALLRDLFERLGVETDYLVPHRVEDGYGLSRETIQRLADRGADLLITADCGVTAADEIGCAKDLGLEVVVVDHHSVPDELPPADAVLDPHRDDCAFPFEEMSAAGVSFNLAVALRAELRKRGAFEGRREPNLKSLLDLVALGTIADVVPLVDENRMFARFGLELIARQGRPGVRALMEEADSSSDGVDAETISYDLAPRMNAAGRIDDASMCVDLLTTSDEGRARRIAARLEALNDERREMQRSLLDEAIDQASRQVEEQQRRVLVVDGEGWHEGLLGIVAGRVSDAFHRPAVAFRRDGDHAKGSARSIDGIDLVELFGEVDDMLDEYGGHAAAAGLELSVDDISSLREALNRTVERWLDENELPQPAIEIDESVELGDLEEGFVEDLDRLRPFGRGNPKPVFVCHRAESRDSRIVGTDHLKADFSDGSGQLGGIGFSMGDAIDLLEERVSVAFVPKYTYFRGRGRLEMHLRDLRPSADPDSHFDETP